MYLLGMNLGILYEQNREKESPRPPDEIVKNVLRLYNSKINVPDSIYIGLPGNNSNEVHLFEYSDPIKGLSYKGIYVRDEN
jgi:hypothetical protein